MRTLTLSPAERLLTLLATALFRLPLRAGAIRLPPKPDPLLIRALAMLEVHQLGNLNHVADAAVVSLTVPRVLDLLERPLGEWFMFSPEEEPLRRELGEEALLIGGSPSDLCLQLTLDVQDPEAEHDERAIMLAIRALCVEHGRPDAYSAARRHLVEHPVGTFDTLQAPFLRTPLNSVAWGNLYKDGGAYEVLPPEAMVNGQVRLCPHCHWTLEYMRDGRWRCGDEWCRYVTGDFVGARIVPADPELRRVVRVVRAAAVGPEVGVLHLERRLLALGVGVELWPAFDDCDLSITFPDGAHWGIDYKDWRSAYLLARRLNQQLDEGRPFGRAIALDAWDRAWYVVPDEREAAEPGYTRELLTSWRWKDRQRLTAATASTFLRAVRRHVKGGGGRA